MALPSSFRLNIGAKLLDGGWQSFPLVSEELVDGIVNAMAAMLALKTRIAASSDDVQITAARILRAVPVLRRMLQSLDFSLTDTVAFEGLIFAHLKTLKQHCLTF